MTSSWDTIRDVSLKLKGLSTIGLANILANAISGLFWLYMARILGTAQYGEVSYLLAIAGVGIIFSYLGSTNTILVYVPKGVKLQASLYFVALTASIVAGIILYIIFHNVGVSLYPLGNVIFGLATSDLLAKKKYRNYFAYFIAYRLLMVGLAIGLYRLIGVDGVILGLSLSFLPASIVIYKGFRESKIDFSLLKARIGFIINSYVLDMTRSFSTTADKLIVAPLLGYSLLGNYSLGLQFLSLLSILPGVVYQYILPHDATGVPNRKLKQATILISILLAILSIILSPILLPILFPKFTQAIGVIQIISIGVIPIAISNVYISKFLAKEESRIVLIGSAIFLAVQVPAIFLLGNFFGIGGVATSFVLAQSSETAYLFFVNRHYKGKPIELSQTGEPVLETTLKVDTQEKYNIADKFKIFSSKPVITLAVIAAVGAILRLQYFPYHVPLVLDAFNNYFLYATDISILGHLPANFQIANDGWPIFLSFFFTIFRFDNFLDYMTLQRAVTLSISAFTPILVYLLCRRFVERPYALLGAAIFAFDPRIIQNSVLGLTDPLFIALIAGGLAMFFSQNKKFVYASFTIVGFSSIVRAEGLFVFLPLVILFFLRFRKESKIVLKGVLSIGIYIAVLLPIAIFRIKTMGNDEITGRVIYSSGQLLTNESSPFFHLKDAIENIVKFTGWSLVPIFVFLVPIGIYLIFRKKYQNSLSLLVLMCGMILPVFYAFTFAPDTRYIYPLFPIFCILGGYTVRELGNKKGNHNLLAVIVIAGVLLSSSAFLDLKKTDFEHQREAFAIATYVVKTANGVNDYYPDDSYLGPARISDKWPALSTSIKDQPAIIPTTGFDSLSTYIKSSQSKGLTHLILDGAKNRPVFLNDVFYHEEKYPYLTKVFDSSDQGYKYHVKIYKINYDVFNSLANVAAQ